MKTFRLNIDGREVTGIPGQTILEVAKENDIFIPTFCFDDRTEIYGACGICVVEVEGNPKMVKACATEIAPNMIILTKTDRVIESRKTNLELLLSNHVGDCRPPCATACPAGTDCQGYVGLIANGQFEDAIELIKEKIPLPASIGRVCPHPCETDCRRKLIEEPISIAWLKSFAADADLFGEDPFIPSIKADTFKSVAVIGGGPYGLSVAYFLRRMGHEVTVFEAMPKFGGMLRYGIPEYRLPKEVLDEEIAIIEKMGVELVPNTKVGVDFSFDMIRENYDAVCVGIGAWISTGVGCKGEDAEGVIGGIDFLRKVVRNETLTMGENVAIVGGGNTAMDACRTAVRLGAKNVYNIYRRTKDEMPADMVEIVEAEEEGVIFKNLTNPIEVVKGKDGKVKEVILQVMELGEPDSSGRRAPVPVKGKTETIKVDTVILAIGQAVDPKGFKGIDMTKKKGIAYDPDTFMTSIEGVFAGGDCGNDKISIAIEAIADAKKSSEVIDAYLKGEKIRYKKPYLVKRDDITEKTFEDRERQCRPVMDHLHPEERKDNFSEIVFGYEEDQAVDDATRCLECGCHDYFECKLIDFANEYDVSPTRFGGEINKIEFEDSHPFIMRDPNKCILCGLCVRICEEVVGVSALGLVDRGFDTVVKPTLEKPLEKSGCVSCGQCVNVCPTGALGERLTIAKPVPLSTEIIGTTCSFCSVGCSIDLYTHSNLLLKANPDKEGAVNRGLICGKGKFGFDCAELEDKIIEPMVKNVNVFEEIDYHEAFMKTAKKVQSVAAKYGKDSIAVAISDRYTNEEAYLIKKFADMIEAKTLCFNNRASGIEKVIGLDGSPNTIEELLSTEVILVAGFMMNNNPVIGLKLSQAAKNGAKIIYINPKGFEGKLGFASKTVNTKNDVDFLKQIAKKLCEMKPGKTKDFKMFAASLEDIKVSKEASEIAEIYGNAKKAMVLFQQNLLTVEAATLLADIAVVSGHIGSPRDGILQVKAKNNSQGLVDLGIKAGAEAMEGVKALLIFGEDPAVELTGLEFLMVSDTHITSTAEKADVIIPGTGFASTEGTFTNTERRLMIVEPAVDEDVAYANWEIASELAHVFEVEMDIEDAVDISTEMDELVDIYKYANVDEVFNGVYKPSKVMLTPVGKAKMADPLTNTDNLMNVINSRLPKPAM